MKITKGIAQCLRDVHMGRRPKTRSLTKARALELVDRVLGASPKLTARGREAANAHVSCPCGWWQSTSSIEAQRALEVNLDTHKLTSKNPECRA